MKTKVQKCSSLPEISSDEKHKSTKLELKDGIPEYKKVSIAMIKVDVTIRQRQDFTEEEIKELAEKIKSSGWVAPLVVDQNCNLIAGFRRYLALKLLDWTEVYIQVIPVDEKSTQLIEFLENSGRKDLCWQDRIRAIEKIQLLYGAAGIKGKGRPAKCDTVSDLTWSSEKTANLLGLNVRTIERAVKLATGINLYPEITKANTETSALKMLQQIDNKNATSENTDEMKGKKFQRTRTFINKTADKINNLLSVDLRSGISIEEFKTLLVSVEKIKSITENFINRYQQSSINGAIKKDMD